MTTESILSLIAPMVLGAQLILTLVLVKGEVCPGQRGRLHKLLPVPGVLWLAVSSVQISAFLSAFAIFYFYSQVRTKKTRKKGPLWVLYLAAITACYTLFSQFGDLSGTMAHISWVILALLLGAVFANLLLLVAGSRLEAFHKLLPVSGIISGIVLAVSIAVQVGYLTAEQVSQTQNSLLLGLGMLVVGLLIWPMHMVTNKPVNKAQLVVSLLLLMSAGIHFYPLLCLDMIL